METKSPAFLDSPFSYDFDQYIQYPADASPYNIPLPQPTPPLEFASLNLDTDYVGSYPSNNGANIPSNLGKIQRPYTPVDAIAPHATTGLVQSGSEDGFTSSSYSQLVHRRGSSASIHAGRMSAKERSTAARRRSSKDDDFDSDEDGNDVDYAPGDSTEDRPKASGAKRRDEVRRQRIESEQRRRDELRDGYAKLREVLPSSNQKASKISLLDRATTHIRYLEITVQQLQTRLQQAEAENQRLRLLNEKMMLATAEHNVSQQALAAAAAQASMAQY